VVGRPMAGGGRERERIERVIIIHGDCDICVSPKASRNHLSH
jgi:hypothetical protein